LKPFIRNFIVFFFATLLSINVFATGKATPEDAVAMVKKAAAFYKEHGRDKALAEFNNQKGQFVKDELYLFVYDEKGLNLAHGQNPKMVGKNLLEMRDANGLYMIKKVIELGNSKAGSGWQTYEWPNTLTKTVETKQSYTEKVGDIYISCGIYK
jgi:cytochrome c